MIQHSQSDLELLVEVAERAGLYPTLRGETLHLVTLQGIGEPLSLALGESLHEVRIEVNAEPACRLVSAAGWNPLRAMPYRARASAPRSGRDVMAQVDPGRVGGSGERTLVNEIAADEHHAEAIAQADLDCRVAREIILSGVAEGNPRLRPGSRISVRGIGGDLSGRYVLTGVTHVIDQRAGFLSELSTLPPPLRSRQRGMLAALGTVTRVDDPEGRGRVRVVLPAYDEVETPWMGVLSAGAGAGKGLVMLPDVGDQVLVLLSPDDPAQGIVLGGLYGLDVKDPAVRRYDILTPGGQRIRLDDEHGLVRLENKSGSHVEMGPEAVRVHSSVDLQIEAPGRRVTIRGDAIDLERA
jgi:phage baseplate assembly protein gpV